MKQRPPYIVRCRQLIEQDMACNPFFSNPAADLDAAIDEYHDVRAIQRHMDPGDSYDIAEDVRRYREGEETEEDLHPVLELNGSLDREVRAALDFLKDSSDHWHTVDVPLIEYEQEVAEVKRRFYGR